MITQNHLVLPRAKSYSYSARHIRIQGQGQREWLQRQTRAHTDEHQPLHVPGMRTPLS
jgi:hypothetical protein